MRQRKIIILAIIAILGVIILAFFPMFPGFHEDLRFLEDYTANPSSESILFVRNLDENRSYSVRVSMSNATWLDPETFFRPIPPSSFNKLKIPDSICPGNYSVRIFVDGNDAAEYPVTLPSDHMFVLYPGGQLERIPWVFNESADVNPG
jgi:hypothetical protein